jgi:hypothetical protein
MSMPIKNNLIDLYNKMSNEDKVFMIELMRKDISVFVDVKVNQKRMGYHMDLDSEIPVSLNGISVELNLESKIKIKDGDFI